MYRIIEEYAQGNIITKEEALSQMVVGLAKTWTELQDRHIDLVRRSVFPPILTPP